MTGGKNTTGFAGSKAGAKAKPSEPLAIPSFQANGVHVLSTGNDVMFVFLALQPTIGNEAVMAPVVSVAMSRGAATDLLTVVQGVMDTVEKDFGRIDTPMLRLRREEKK